MHPPLLVLRSLICLIGDRHVNPVHSLFRKSNGKVSGRSLQVRKDPFTEEEDEMGNEVMLLET